MLIRRVGVIFDSIQRPETTGTCCLRALKGLVEVEHFQPGELDRIPHASGDGVEILAYSLIAYEWPIAVLAPEAAWPS